MSKLRRSRSVEIEAGYLRMATRNIDDDAVTLLRLFYRIVRFSLDRSFQLPYPQLCEQANLVVQKAAYPKPNARAADGL